MFTLLGLVVFSAIMNGGIDDSVSDADLPCPDGCYIDEVCTGSGCVDSEELCNSDRECGEGQICSFEGDYCPVSTTDCETQEWGRCERDRRCERDSECLDDELCLYSSEGTISCDIDGFCSITEDAECASFAYPCFISDTYACADHELCVDDVCVDGDYALAYEDIEKDDPEKRERLLSEWRESAQGCTQSKAHMVMSLIGFVFFLRRSKAKDFEGSKEHLVSRQRNDLWV